MPEDQMKSVTYYCADCLVYFQVIVEPDKDEELIKQEYPDAEKFKDKIEFCPHCGSENISS